MEPEHTRAIARIELVIRPFIALASSGIVLICRGPDSRDTRAVAPPEGFDTLRAPSSPVVPAERPIDLRVVDFVAANAAVLLGAILQASTGLGAGLIIVPLLALVSLDFVPGPVVLASVALSGI